MSRVRAIDWEQWTPALHATLLFVVRHGQILLIHKKRGLGAGKVNGAGGKVDPGETPLHAAEREFAEELCARPVGVAKRGELLFHVLDDDSIHVHVFRASGLVGTLRETDEAVPMWVPVPAIPYERMWEDDRFWMPHFVAGRQFEIRTVFAGDRLLDHELTIKMPDFEWAM